MKATLRLALSFFAAYGLNAVLHECAHALTAHFLGLPARLFPLHVDIGYPSGDSEARVLCAIAGPLFSLGLGWFCGALYRRLQSRPEALLLLYSSILGTSFFLGNLFSASLVAGDLSAGAEQLHLAGSVRLGMTLTGGLLLAAFLYRMGPELLPWTRPETNPLEAAIQVIVFPVVLGTVLVIVAFRPMSRASIQDWAASSLFWIFAAAGVVVARKRGLKGRGCAA